LAQGLETFFKIEEKKPPELLTFRWKYLGLIYKFWELRPIWHCLPPQQESLQEGQEADILLS
jgi:hypothetical protein